MPRETNIQLADEVGDYGRILIAKYHEHLSDAKILYLFTDQRRKRCDRVLVGTASRLDAMSRFLASGLQSVLSGPDFLMLIDVQEWSTLDDAQRRAVVDHELCHMAVFVSEDGRTWERLTPGDHKDEYQFWRYGLRGHDIEEFSDVVKRHGWWRRDLPENQFADVVRQLLLPLDDKVPDVFQNALT